MEKSLLDTSSMPSVDGAVSATTAARSRPSPKTVKKSSSKGVGLSKSVMLDIFMADLNRMQEVFGKIHFLRPDGDEPAIFVLPKTLDVCQICGLVIPRSAAPLCETHAVSAPELAG